MEQPHNYKRGKMPEKNYFLRIDKSQIVRFEGDLGLVLWYSALKDYARRFKPDKHGFIRVSNRLIATDYGLDKQKARRMSKQLEKLGLIVLDNVARGGRTPTGFKMR